MWVVLSYCNSILYSSSFFTALHCTWMSINIYRGHHKILFQYFLTIPHCIIQASPPHCIAFRCWFNFMRQLQCFISILYCNYWRFIHVCYIPIVVMIMLLYNRINLLKILLSLLCLHEIRSVDDKNTVYCIVCFYRWLSTPEWENGPFMIQNPLHMSRDYNQTPLW